MDDEILSYDKDYRILDAGYSYMISCLKKLLRLGLS